MTKKILWLFLLIVLIVFYFVTLGTPKRTNYRTNDFFENQKKLSVKIKTEGIYKTYDYFRKNFATYEPSTSHYLGHYLGEQAYKILSDAGFDVCDFGLDYGCIHGFVIAGINERGNGFFDTVMNRCKNIDPLDLKRSSCIHGVSHTVLSLKGYTFNDLKWSLGKCDTLLEDDKFDSPGACYSAVFMEYNLMSLDGEKNGEWFVTRTLDTNNPTNPCEDLGAKYQWACYSEMSSFWMNNFGPDYERMARYCKSATLKRSKEGCFWGLGRAMSDIYRYDVEKVGNECRKISPNDMLYSCIFGASIVIKNNGNPDAPFLCDYLTGEEKEKCKNIF